MRSALAMKTFGILLLAGFLAAGCTTASLKELRRTAPKGTPFQNALSALYLEYAESEAAQYDWAHSQYFAEKGLSAAYGKDVEPERLENWDIAPDTKAEMTQARETLMQFLNTAVAARPDHAARAQYYFDCWVEQAQEGWQPDDIESCRQGLANELRGPAAIPSEMPMTEGLPAAPATAPDPVPAAVPRPAMTSYMLFFSRGITLLPEAERVMATVISNLKQHRDHQVVLNGHTDREGTEQQNLDLSQKRVDAVKARLVAGGIAAKRIQTFAFGESDPAKATADGVASPANRRVEIFVSP